MSCSATVEKLIRFLETPHHQASQRATPAQASNDDKFYLTTAIVYTNGPPHAGHAYEAITSDVISRYHRIQGRNVFFLTGTDEHGQKIAESAAANKPPRTPKQHCDFYANKLLSLNKQLLISNDRFIRTTDKYHEETAKALYLKACKAGDIYLKKYEGWYNVREETFVTENEAKLADYKDKTTGLALTKNSEETFFFRMSKYQKQLLNHIHTHPEFIQPESVRELILKRLEDDLRDLCVSRTTFDWGIPVPKFDGLPDPTGHVIYVWFDALINYVSGVDYPNGDLAHFWPADVHVIGKDIAWFHCVIWPCMLWSCNLPLPKTVFSHGWVNAEDGNKMSKSVGNVVDPVKILKTKKADVLRFFLCKQATYGADLKFSYDDMDRVLDGLLVHVWGNYVQRSLQLTIKFCDGKVPNAKPIVISPLEPALAEIDNLIKNFKLQEASEFVVDFCRLGNNYIQEAKPWELKSSDQKEKQSIIIRTALEHCYVVAHLFEPFCPEAAERVFKQLGTPKTSLRKLNGNYENLTPGTALKPDGKVLFEQIITKFQKKQQKETKGKGNQKQGKGNQKKQKGQANQGSGPHICQLEFKVGKVLEVSNHPTAGKLYVEKIDVGEGTPRTIVSGLRGKIEAEDFNGSLVVVFSNLKTGKLQKVKSEGMVLCAVAEDGSTQLLRPPEGSKIGERIFVKGIDYKGTEPKGKVDSKKKNHPWVKTKASLTTNADCVACFEGKPLITSAGKVKCDSLSNTQIG